MIVHTRSTFSLLDCIEQLYDIVSPGQSISDLLLFPSIRFREIDPNEMEKISITKIIIYHKYLPIISVQLCSSGSGIHDAGPVQMEENTVEGRYP